MSNELKPCPFCGEIPKGLNYYTNQGTKWGFASCPDCGANSPEVRTSYNTSENAEWHNDAIEAWNTRPESAWESIASRKSSKPDKFTVIVSSNNDMLIFISECDYKRLNKYKWSTDKRGYVFRETKRNNKYTRILIHREIMECDNKMLVVDHRDGNPLNNVRSNLRICTQKNNTQNSKAINKTSKYKGVHKLNRYNKEKNIVYISDGGATRQVNGIENERIAAIIYDLLALDRFGEYARFNYPVLIDKIEKYILNNKQ